METIKESVQAAEGGQVNDGEGEAHKGSHKYSSSPKGEIGISSSAEGLLNRRNPGSKR